MDKLVVTLLLTDDEALSMRLALNAHAMSWGERASEARELGKDVDAATCERIRTSYHHLWDKVNLAQENARAADLEAREARAGTFARKMA
jgi:hypothetical protein